MHHTGVIKWQGTPVFLTETLINEVVGVVETDEGDAEVYFGAMMLGLIDGVSLKLRRLQPTQSSTMGRGGQPSSRSSHPTPANVLPIMPV